MQAFPNGKIINNILWLLFDKAYGALLTLYIFSLLAKHFGLEVFGIWNYMLAFTALLPAFSSLGLNYVIVKNIKERPFLSSLILGNTLLTRLYAGLFFGMALFIVYIFLGINNQSEYLWPVGFLFISQIVLNSNVFIFQNEANLDNKKTVLHRNIALTVCSLLRFLGIEFGLELLYFAIINFVEYGLFLILSLIFSHINLKKKDFLLSKKINLVFIKDGLPLMLSSVVVILYLKIDQLIIAYLEDNNSVGIYSAASRITEMFYALPVIFSNAFFPKILGVKKDIIKRNLVMEKMHAFTLGGSFVVAVLISVFSSHIVLLLYGESYRESIEILQVYAWSLLFMALLVSSSKFLLVIGRNDIIFKRGVLGLVSNVIFNFIFIPIYGTVGAAYATLISYFIAAYASNIFFKDLRPLMSNQITSVFRVLYRLINGIGISK